jgi:hypothetical protein
MRVFNIPESSNSLAAAYRTDQPPAGELLFRYRGALTALQAVDGDAGQNVPSSYRFIAALFGFLILSHDLSL